MYLDLPSDASHSGFRRIWGWMSDPDVALGRSLNIVPALWCVFAVRVYLDLSSVATGRDPTSSDAPDATRLDSLEPTTIALQ